MFVTCCRATVLFLACFISCNFILVIDVIIFVKIDSSSSQSSSTKACRPLAELLLLELSILTKIITMITKIVKMFFMISKGLQPLFPARNDVKSAKQLEKVGFGALC